MLICDVLSLVRSLALLIYEALARELRAVGGARLGGRESAGILPATRSLIGYMNFWSKLFIGFKDQVGRAK